MGDYKIDRGVEIPETETRSKYPYRDMRVGDSIFLPRPDTHGPRAWANGVRSTFIAHTKRYGGAFTTRSVVEDGVSGVRVWRMEDGNYDRS